MFVLHAVWITLSLHFCNTQCDWEESTKLTITSFKWGLGAIFNHTSDFTLPPTVETHNTNPRQKSKRTNLQPQLLPHSCKYALNFWRNKLELKEVHNKIRTKLEKKPSGTNKPPLLSCRLDCILQTSLDCTTHKHFMLERGFRTCLKNTATSNAFLSFK